MQKDTIHYGGWEHRDVHNIGGMIYVSTERSSSGIQRMLISSASAKPHSSGTD